MDDDQQFCLRWNNHQSTLISVFDTLLEKGIHVDCTLAAEGQTLKAHKVVLSACSPYFESVLGQQYDKHPIIILKDVKFAELRAMMDYMYRGEVNISQDQLGALLKAAESLQIKGLSDNKPTPPPRPASPPLKLRNVRNASPAPEDHEGSRDGSLSPTRRKRKKRRTSVSPAPLASLPHPPLLNNNPVSPNHNGTENDTMAKIKLIEPNDDSAIKTKTEISEEVTLEPKSEFGMEGNEDSVEDLTLDEEAYSDAEHIGAGTSQSVGDASAQGFPWHMDRSQEELSVGPDGPRDSQEARVTRSSTLKESKENKTLDIPVVNLDLEESLFADTDIDGQTESQIESAILSICRSDAADVPLEVIPAGFMEKALLLRENILLNNNIVAEESCEAAPYQKRETESDTEYDDTDDILLPDESEIFGNSSISDEEEGSTARRGRLRGSGGGDAPRQFVCRHCSKRYRWKSTLRRHESVECGGKPPAHACPYCVYRAKQRGNLGVHIRKHHNAEWSLFANTKLRKAKKITS